MRIAKSDVVTLRDSHIVAGANERRLYSQASLSSTLRLHCVNSQLVCKVTTGRVCHCQYEDGKWVASAGAILIGLKPGIMYDD